jgi:hypothetical protein
MDPLVLLDLTRDFIGRELTQNIQSMDLLDEHFMLKVIFDQGSLLFIRYNQFHEYSYQFFFSQQKNDYIRYDNFDDRWNVASRPHHFHDRNKRVISS